MSAWPLVAMVGVACVLMPMAHAQQADYVIGVRDVLSVTVWQQPDLTGRFNVESDGALTFPLVGRVKAAGLAVRDLEDRLTKLLTQGYVKNPQVTVAVDQYRSQMVHIVGEVKQPGTYSLTGEMTLIELLARAGSTTLHAGGVATISRRTPGPAPAADSGVAAHAPPPQLIGANLRRLQSGELRENLVLQDGDVVFIPRAEMVYILGEVKSPGAYALQEETTLVQAIALAGGVTDRGSLKRVRIRRQVNGRKQELKGKPDDPLQPGDTVVVLERLF